MRRAAAAPSGDGVTRLAASTGGSADHPKPGLQRSACSRSTLASQRSPRRRAARRDHSRSPMPSSRTTPAWMGRVAASRSQARKSLSGNRYRRQQGRPSWSWNNRCSRKPSLSTPPPRSAHAACAQPDSSPPDCARYRHSTVPSAASCDGRGNGAAMASVGVGRTACGIDITIPRQGSSTGCGRDWCSGPAWCRPPRPAAGRRPRCIRDRRG